LFAGGEKSGLAVHNPADPRKTVKGILERARKYVQAKQDPPALLSSLSCGTSLRLRI
jgi:hypothetical protein